MHHHLVNRLGEFLYCVEIEIVGTVGMYVCTVTIDRRYM